MRFLLFVGAGNTLAESEIANIIPSAAPSYPNSYIFESDSLESGKSLAESLGSSIKLAFELTGVSSEPVSISEKVTHKNFSVTCLDDSSKSAIYSQEVKNTLNKGRFILSKDQFGLSPVLLTKHKVDEFLVDIEKDEVWQTVWVHDYEHWIKKDRHMPHINPHAGMLPPKIARSMVNLVPRSNREMLLVDPFCGSGRVLVEAAELGFKVSGSDAVSSQSMDSLDNLRSLRLEGDVTTLDATHLSTKFRNNVDVIVTEPFLGKPNPRPDQIKYIVPGLRKLYIGCLKDWLSVLKPGGYIVMVFPEYYDGKKVYKTSDIIDDKLKLSYNQLKRGILYSRPDADVKREIVILQKI